MARYTGPKHKISRRFKVPSLNGNSNSKRSDTPPGMHGNARRRKQSEYGLQLTEMQKLRFYYMISKKQLVRAFREAVRLTGSTPENLVSLLERRLDVSIFRLKLATTTFAAQQLVSHGHVLVNGKKVDIRSYLVKVGDIITIKEKSREKPFVTAAVARDRSIPAYWDDAKGTLVHNPTIAEATYPVDINVEQICSTLHHNT